MKTAEQIAAETDIGHYASKSNTEIKRIFANAFAPIFTERDTALAEVERLKADNAKLKQGIISEIQDAFQKSLDESTAELQVRSTGFVGPDRLERIAVAAMQAISSEYQTGADWAERMAEAAVCQARALVAALDAEAGKISPISGRIIGEKHA